ncbi:BRCT domain-containing protein [Rozella allomycis CSF55]|uniref:BRCT domain-containing protein n=1 Tax=Rozella allomycis (strain CSF55) TaxID=988480 RepID=A0A4P9YE37_ROZAC|nr:BRCT domain-containing protein [Rozella allomycis CSF55]
MTKHKSISLQDAGSDGDQIGDDVTEPLIADIEKHDMMDLVSAIETQNETEKPLSKGAEEIHGKETNETTKEPTYVNQDQKEDIKSEINKTPRKRKKTSDDATEKPIKEKKAKTSKKYKSLEQDLPTNDVIFKVLFTGVVDNKRENMIRSLGGSVVDSVDECDILCTDKIRRTVKFLCCLASGKPIVSLNWVNESKKAGKFIGNPSSFYIKDPVNEKKFDFKLSESIEQAKKTRIFNGMKFYVTKETKAPQNDLKSIILSGGGEVLDNFEENCIVVGQSDQHPCHSEEMIFSGTWLLLIIFSGIKTKCKF